MSSSEEDEVRRPGRSTDASRHQTLSPSLQDDHSDGMNGDVHTPLSDRELNNADEEDDLFGSEGEDDESVASICQRPVIPIEPHC